MGIHDRDWYREQHRNGSSISRDHSRPSKTTIALIWVGAGALIFGAIHLLSQRAPAEQHAPPRPAVDAPVGNAPARAVTTPPVFRSAPSLPATAARPTGPTPIYRCGNSYSQSPCANAHVVEAPAASGFESRPTQAYADYVARGRTEGSGSYTTVTNTVTTVDGVSRSGAAIECQQISEEIAGIDRSARRPQSLQEQDRLRERRHRASDRRAALHC